VRDGDGDDDDDEGATREEAQGRRRVGLAVRDLVDPGHSISKGVT
jgi:hypothetical protein